ncbi:hypothetical protein BH10ACT3_BH10ACT3_20240 [soil metagenome]
MEPTMLKPPMPGAFAAGDVRRGSVRRLTSTAREGVVQLLHGSLAEQRQHVRN